MIIARFLPNISCEGKDFVATHPVGSVQVLRHSVGGPASIAATDDAQGTSEGSTPTQSFARKIWSHIPQVYIL